MPTVQIQISDDVFLPVYRHLRHETDYDIDFIYGSRDSGKSRDTAQRLVEQCLESDYFRCILARKTFNTIKDSQWQLIKDVVDDWGLSQFFEFKVSPLEIVCVNGNRFLARGFDDPQKIKSIQNPSNAWVEEGNELTLDDWTILITSLRSNFGRTKTDFTFNPECEGDYRDFWLYKDYFSHTQNQSFAYDKEVKIGNESFTLKVRATHTTYRDNPYCTPQRKAIYESLKDSDPFHYQVYALGRWGVREVKAPFAFSFKREKHVGSVQHNPSETTYLSFDFNRNPICCTVFQFYDDTVWGVETIKLPHSDIYQLCQVIRAKYPDALFVVTGDFSGYNASALVRDDVNYFKVIKSELELSDGQIQVIRNPIIEENQVTCNKSLHQIPHVFDEHGCAPLIFDLQFAEMLPTGQLKKGDREDPKQQLDALDTWRYFENKFIKPLLT